MKIFNCIKSHIATILWIVLFGIQVLFFYSLPKFPKLWQYFDDFFEVQKSFHLKIFSILPLPIGDILYLILSILVLRWLILQCKKWSWRRMNGLLIGMLIFHFCFQVFWGIKYHTEPLYSSSEEEKFSDDEVFLVTKNIIDKANKLRTKLTDKEINSSPEKIISRVGNAIIRQQKNPPSAISKSEIPTLNVQSSLYTPILSYLGVLGYYNPFTAEAYINTHQPAATLPFTIAHEMAHQMGVANEADANFVAYLYGSESNDTLLSYSVYLQAISYLLFINKNEDSSNKLKKMLHPLVEKDLTTKYSFSKQYNGYFKQSFSTLNDWFLKSNQQDGIISYSFVGYKIMKYELEKKPK